MQISFPGTFLGWQGEGFIGLRLTDEKLHGKLAFGWQGGWKMHAIRRRAVPRWVNAIRLVSHLSLTWDPRKRDTLGLTYNSNNFNIIIIK